jgi:RHS repeat-associated protein
VLPQSAPTPAPNQVYRLYYYASARRVAVRVWTGATGTNDLYFLHSDHLGSTTVTTDLSQNIVGQQRYYAYGEPRNTSGALHTDRRFTGQREETGLGSLYDYNARYYSPLIGRFISADTIVPGAGNPQALNRYAYVLGNPLKYTDPSGHDVMIVPGFSANAYADPEDWEVWIRYYKGWDQGEWLDYYNQWMDADDAGKQALMKEHGVYYYRWANDDSMLTGVDDNAVNELHRQMNGMLDITLIGHSKGANLVQNYLARYGSDGVKAVLLKAPNEPYIAASGSREPGSPFALQNCYLRICTGPRSYSGNGKIVNIHGAPDFGGGSAAIDGTINFPSNDDQDFGGVHVPSNHGHAPNLAMATFYALNVSHDHGSGFRVFAGGLR